tara:strand:+ start:164 stop:1228 length:1065 start_codon:yes stop_codon:yes gene_type:complete
MKDIIKIFSDFTYDNDEVIDPYIIAEVGVNHEGDLDTAKRLIDEAAGSGADAVKFQSYKASTLAAKESPAYWDLSKEPTTSQFALFQKHDKFWKSEFEELKKYCDESKVEFLSTPFDIESAGFLNEMMPVFKISSSDITNKPFIEHIAEFGKPIILSTGASELYEVQRAVFWINETGVDVGLLHCILNYPTENKNANLGMIKSLQKEFPEHIIGYSDHTLPGDMGVLLSATLLGARIIEKHFTHDKSLPGNDHYHAMDWQDLKQFKLALDRELGLIGSQHKASLPSEKPAINNARRSLVALTPITKGQEICRENITWKRPASGICPSEIDNVLGKFSLRDIEADEILDWSMITH